MQSHSANGLTLSNTVIVGVAIAEPFTQKYGATAALLITRTLAATLFLFFAVRSGIGRTRAAAG